MAGLCIFLSSRAGSWVTGAIIPLEGGVLAKAKLWKLCDPACDERKTANKLWIHEPIRST